MLLTVFAGWRGLDVGEGLRGDVDNLANVPPFDSKPLQNEIAAMQRDFAKLKSVPAFDPKTLEDRIAALRGDIAKLKSVPTPDPKPIEEKIAVALADRSVSAGFGARHAGRGAASGTAACA